MNHPNRGWRRPLAFCLIISGFLLFGSSTAAYAHGMESLVSSELVQQALSLIANDGGIDRIAEKIQDAVEAPDTEGVDVARLELALAALESDPSESGVEDARALLILAAPQFASAPPAPRAIAGDTGTTAVLDPLEPLDGVNDGGDLTLLIVALAAIGLGLLLSRRLRPHHSIHELRKTSASLGDRS